MRHRVLKLVTIGITLMWVGARVAATADSPAGVLGVKVAAYDVRDVSIIEALRQLKQSVGDKEIILTLEVAPFEEKVEENISLAISDGTVREVLEQIIRLDPRYAYSVFQGELIHVFPIRAKDDPNDLLNTKVKEFNISGVAYDRLLQYPDHYIPELGAEILRRSKAGGVAGAMMSSTGVPSVSLEVRNATVRNILNEISLRAARTTKARVTPLGWVYTYRVDKSVPLGGHPQWKLF